MFSTFFPGFRLSGIFRGSGYMGWLSWNRPQFVFYDGANILGLRKRPLSWQIILAEKPAFVDDSVGSAAVSIPNFWCVIFVYCILMYILSIPLLGMNLRQSQVLKNGMPGFLWHFLLRFVSTVPYFNCPGLSRLSLPFECCLHQESFSINGGTHLQHDAKSLSCWKLWLLLSCEVFKSTHEESLATG